MNSRRMTKRRPSFSHIVNRAHFLLVIIPVWLVLTSGCDAPLITYEPETSEEKALKATLLDFQTGVNAKDFDKVAALIHPDARIMIGREKRMLSKDEYLRVLRQRLAESPPVALGLPRMTITGHQSEVRVYMTRGDAKILMVFHLLFDGGKWRIRHWEY